VTLQDKGGAKSKPVKWSPAETRVEIAITGDKVAFSLDGKPASSLIVSGISRQKGTVTFRARQCACAIDNVVLRSQE